MSSPPPIDAIAPWIELLCEAGDARVQDRLLLECVLALGGARAVALWRRERRGRGWRVSASRGVVDLLPRQDEVEALARGSLPAEALPGKRIVAAGDALLALGGATDDEDLLDLASSMFLTYTLMRDDPLDVDDVAPALPSGTIRGRATTGADVGGELPGADADLSLPLAPLDGGDTARGDTACGDLARGDTARSEMARDDTAHSEAARGETAEARRALHDVRNVLASLKATEDLLTNFSEGLTADETRRFRTVVEQECRRAGRMVASALLGSRANVESTCVASEVLTSVLDAETAPCERERVELRRLIDPALRASSVALSSVDWSRVVHNLIVNARQALARRATTSDALLRSRTGTIWVTLEPAVDAHGRAAARLTVEDDGPGISDADVDRVVEDGFTSGDSGSTGQGLAISRDFALRAGGWLRVGNRASGGARIEVLVPIERATSRS